MLHFTSFLKHQRSSRDFVFWFYNLQITVFKKVNIPRKDNSDLELTLETGKTTIIIGANGSGKTRLAVHLEEQLGEKAHRIAAHRALSLNPNIEKISEAKAKQGFFYGNPEWAKDISQRKSARWNNKSSTYLLNDFDRLLQYLFAQQNNEGRLSISVDKKESEEDKGKNYLHKETTEWQASRGVYLKDATTSGLTS